MGLSQSNEVSEPTETENDEIFNDSYKDLEEKHERRQILIQQKSKELQDLRDEVNILERENKALRDNENNLDLETENKHLKTIIHELKHKCDQYLELSERNYELQSQVTEVTDRLNRSNQQVEMFNKERETYLNHVNALKEVVRVTKEMIRIRDVQLNELQDKIKDIEGRIGDKELVMLSNDLRQQYEKQLNNIRNLRNLYEVRQAELRDERDALSFQLIESKEKLNDSQNENKDLQERIDCLESDASKKYDKISHLESNLGLSEAECRELKSELHVINQLFGQILFGYHNNSYDNIDLDKLLKLLEENHDLLKEISLRETDEYSTVLPKTLLDLISQTFQNDDVSDSCPDTYETRDYVANLPKVWRILITLLNQQEKKSIVLNTNTSDSVMLKDPCYKAVDTPNGPKYVLSLSQTYIRLKDLILEKKHLKKETLRLKQLNGHLESRLQDQESKLESVLSELSKTWHLVDRIQEQHEQLHTHESFLKYELGQKRNLVQDLKKDLNYCKEKWDIAREKTLDTEKQWNSLKSEFDARKSIDIGNNNDTSDDNEVLAGKEIPHDRALFDNYVASRDNRLKHLEDQCSKLVEKVTKTSVRSDEIVSKLDELHQHYG